MQKTAKNPRVAIGALAIILGSFAIAPGVVSAAEASAVEEGKKIAFHRKKGNCLACHKIAGGSLAGNIGPALVNMKARFADKAKLRAKIYDATVSSPNTIMPPFGKHKILTKSELDKVVEFIYTL
ncbi:Sulfur oxidation protein SoxX [hydrothermal vent metagenome]|uniref:Sulfur oxidation protein SoxX n=1 Tax=hydrothermal vent metagenome TaxID=652676 RepID=A0A3B1B0Q2_9ZZZZ